jgi:hypothetical protein
MVTRFDGDGELSRQQKRQAIWLQVARNANCRYTAKAYFTDALKWTDRQCDDSRRRLLLRGFNKIRPADQGTRRLMATLIHRNTVSTSILDDIRRSELQNGKSHGRIGELAERVLTEQLLRCYRFPATCTGLATHVICELEISRANYESCPLAVPDIASSFHCLVVE